MDVVLWPIHRIKPYDKNPRTHSEEHVAQLADMIKEYGWRRPIEVDEDGVVLSGHGRLLAAEVLGITDVPVIQHTDLTEAQKRGYRLADNRIALDSKWRDDFLRGELIDLSKLDFDIRQTGFSDRELERLLADPVTEETGLEEGHAPKLTYRLTFQSVDDRECWLDFVAWLEHAGWLGELDTTEDKLLAWINHADPELIARGRAFRLAEPEE